MVELVVKIIGEGPYGKEKMEELVYEGAQYRKLFFRGDIIKCVPKGWYKTMNLPDGWGILRIRGLEWAHDRAMLLEPLIGGEDGQTRIGRRRYYIDIDQIKGFKTRKVVTVSKRKAFITDKEER